MAATRSQQSQRVLEYLIAQVLDHGQKLSPLVDALNAGQLEGLPAYKISYSTAHKHVTRARQARDAATPLNLPELDRFYKRLWAVAQAELRKLERDAKKPGSLDLKRVTGLEETATRLSRHLASRDSPPEQPQKPEQDSPPTLLHALAAQTDEPRPADADLPTKPQSMAADPQPVVASEEPEHKDGRVLSPAH